ncbi:hypothetical protein Rhe02_65120 [Rhizocola hellebori]|uniref:Uncharacterized protein n=2 Tax=Rhizocola hellebori TaxID=1392758 RepID=A0A8J3QD30_9ACTN|nr:hypothetical protein Rhe02_65120 [Rhizocola hellebori]
MTAGPEADTAFFDALGAVFDKHPQAKTRYAIGTARQEAEKLGIDFAKQHAVARVEGSRIITSFHDNDGGEGPEHSLACCEWGFVGGEWKCKKKCPT